MKRYPPASSGQRRTQNSPRFPKGFTTIRDLLDGAVSNGKLVSIIGVVKDFRAPIPTRGTDHKCMVTLFNEWDEADIDINIFRKEADMPDVEAGDVVMVSMAKVQYRNGIWSLLTNARTDIHVFDGSTGGALKSSNKRAVHEPDAQDKEYVLWMLRKIDRSLIPEPEQFSERKKQSLNVKEKFSLLQDVKEGKFADLVVQVVKEPWDGLDMVTLWVSDYTENSFFFYKTSDSMGGGVPVRDGDEFGYTNGRKKQASHMDGDVSGWDGPMGKKSMQLSCWEPHADFIRNNVHKGDWVRLRNVQIRTGHNSTNLEGALRSDLKFPDRVYVELLQAQGDRDTIDPRLVEALRRKRDNEKENKQAHKTGEKRKATEPPKENSKSKRKRQREQEREARNREQVLQEAALNLNPVVVSEHEDKAIVPLSTILEPVMYTTKIGDDEVQLKLPFTCAKYRTNARVVDFHPASLKDFAIGRAVTEYDVLSDNGNDSDSASSKSSADSEHEAPNTRRKWEWRFALKLEEVSVSPKTKPAQTWVVVNNLDAQLLLGLDALNLHAPYNAEHVDTLRERLFILWGNLEERKSRREAKKQQHAQDPTRAPPPDSSDEENNGARANHAADDVPGSQLTNRPFTCCIRQYGVKVKVDPEKGELATAGEGKAWRRVFGLFGTKIKY